MTDEDRKYWHESARAAEYAQLAIDDDSVTAGIVAACCRDTAESHERMLAEEDAALPR